jgi:hypothetical protein
MPWHREWVLVKVVLQVMAAKPTTGATRGRRATKPPKWVRHELWLEEHGDEFRAALFRNIKEHLPGLEALRVEAEAQWPPDQVDPFDSRYFEVCEVHYRLQPLTQRISNTLQELLPDRPVRKHFLKIIAQGTGHNFDSSDPADRAKESEAILDAFCRAYYYLKMACDAGRAVEPPPGSRPNWRIALLHLFHLEEL